MQNKKKILFIYIQKSRQLVSVVLTVIYKKIWYDSVPVIFNPFQMIALIGLEIPKFHLGIRWHLYETEKDLKSVIEIKRRNLVELVSAQFRIEV